VPKREIYNVFFFVFLLAVLGAIITVLAPFSGALLGALIIAITSFPLYDRLCAFVPKCSPSLRAALMVLVVLVFIVVPIALICWTLVSESEALAAIARSWSQTLAQWKTGEIINDWPWLDSVRVWMHRTLGIGPRQFQQNVIASVSGLLGAASAMGTSVAQNAFGFLFQTLLMLFTLYFFLRDGRLLVRRLEALFPMRTDDTIEVFSTVHDTIVGVVRGWVLTSVVQGILASIGYFVVGLEGAVLLGLLTGVVGLLPVVGTFGVWVPVAGLLLAKGMYWQAVFILIWSGVLVVGFVDTIVRPYLVGQKAEMPIMYLFFALLGGAEVFGAPGIILGPIFFALAPVLLNIYRRRYLYPQNAIPEPAK
jgi:predicted PurR-regulated permease PerM